MFIESSTIYSVRVVQVAPSLKMKRRACLLQDGGRAADAPGYWCQYSLPPDETTFVAGASSDDGPSGPSGTSGTVVMALPRRAPALKMRTSTTLAAATRGLLRVPCNLRGDRMGPRGV